MLKKSLLAVAAALFLFSLFIPGAFASGLQCVPNGKLNVSCAKNMNTAQLENLKEKLKQIEKTNPTTQNINNLVKIRQISAGKAFQDKGLYK